MRNLSRRLTEAIMKIGGIEASIDNQSQASDLEIVLLYALDDGERHSQREIAEKWELPRSTVNTIVKRWEKEGIIVLEKISGKRREMFIRLTEKGSEKAKIDLSPIYSAEDNALKYSIEKYGETFIEALEYYADMLRQQSDNMNEIK